MKHRPYGTFECEDPAIDPQRCQHADTSIVLGLLLALWAMEGRQ